MLIVIIAIKNYFSIVIIAIKNYFSILNNNVYIQILTIKY